MLSNSNQIKLFNNLVDCWGSHAGSYMALFWATWQCSSPLWIKCNRLYGELHYTNSRVIILELLRICHKKIKKMSVWDDRYANNFRAYITKKNSYWPKCFLLFLKFHIEFQFNFNVFLLYFIFALLFKLCVSTGRGTSWFKILIASIMFFIYSVLILAI